MYACLLGLRGDTSIMFTFSLIMVDVYNLERYIMYFMVIELLLIIANISIYT
jgi:hypothetical protein